MASTTRTKTAQQSPAAGAPMRIGVIAAGTVAASGAWLVTRWLAARFMWSPALAGIAAFCAAWIALYPLARVNRSIPGWAHWARGAFVLVVLWLLTLFSR